MNIIPMSLDDMVPEDNPARAFDAFCKSLDYLQLGFKYAETKGTGRKPYNPCDMTKLYIYGYFFSLLCLSIHRMYSYAHQFQSGSLDLLYPEAQFLHFSACLHYHIHRLNMYRLPEHTLTSYFHQDNMCNFHYYLLQTYISADLHCHTHIHFPCHLWFPLLYCRSGRMYMRSLGRDLWGR